MFTTAALIRSATSAKFTTVGPLDNTAARVTSPPRPATRGALETIGAGVNSPAMMSPTRKAMAADKATVTKVNRLDMKVLQAARPARVRAPLLHYKRLEFLFRERCDPQLPGFCQFRSRVRP